MKKTLFFVGLFVLLSAFSAFAAVNIANQTGTIIITMPDGTSVTVAPGDPLPVIPDGASIEIVSGTADVSVTEGSQIQVSVGGDIATLSSGAAISIVADASGAGTMTVVSGSVDVQKADGTTTTLDSTNPSIPVVVQPYVPAPPPNVDNVEQAVKSEETTKDISAAQ